MTPSFQAADPASMLIGDTISERAEGQAHDRRLSEEKQTQEVRGEDVVQRRRGGASTSEQWPRVSDCVEINQ